MKFRIRENWRTVVIGALLSIACISSVAAQTQRRGGAAEREQLYIVSAKAGGVNHVTGGVRVERANGTKQTFILAKGDELNDKDKVSVGAAGRIEILLNPGSYLRLAENTELEFTSTDLENLKLNLRQGSALIEASAVGGERGADVSIKTPQATVELEKSGIYRINTDINATEIYVWKGEARVGNQIIKAGRKTVVGSNGVAIAAVKFDKEDSRDALDIWSKERAKELAKLNDKLERRQLSRAFSGYGFNSFTGRYGGFWVFNRLTGGYCYVPYGWSYWNSPYGYGYGSGVIYYGGGEQTVKVIRSHTLINPVEPPGAPATTRTVVSPAAPSFPSAIPSKDPGTPGKNPD